MEKYCRHKTTIARVDGENSTCTICGREMEKSPKKVYYWETKTHKFEAEDCPKRITKITKH